MTTENTINTVIMSRCYTILIMANPVMVSKSTRHICNLMYVLCVNMLYTVWINYTWTVIFNPVVIS